jgi:hypothetical protein
MIWTRRRSGLVGLPLENGIATVIGKLFSRYTILYTSIHVSSRNSSQLFNTDSKNFGSRRANFRSVSDPKSKNIGRQCKFQVWFFR